MQRAGFCVLATDNGTHAVQIESGCHGIIHLLLSDVFMPDMSGPVVATLLKKHRPEMRVMLMSGYADGNMLFLKYGWRFIEKPFLPGELVKRVNDVLHIPERSQGNDHFDTRVNPQVLSADA